MDIEVGKGYVLSILRIEDESGRTEISSKARLHRMMYAFSKRHPKFDYGFVPHKYGMYSNALDGILKNMESDGLLCIYPITYSKYGKNTINLTERGCQDADQFAGDDDALKTLQEIKYELNPLTYRQFMVWAYSRFPEMLEKGELVDQFEKWRIKEAVVLYRDGKMSFSDATRMSGLEMYQFSRAQRSVELMQH